MATSTPWGRLSPAASTQSRASQTVGYEHAMGRLAAVTPERPSEGEDRASAATTVKRPVPQAKHSGATALQATELPPSDVDVPGAPSQPGRSRSAVLPSTEQPHRPRPRYELGPLLGEGGMGEVLLAQDTDIGREVALKRLLPERTDPAYIESFAREVRTVAVASRGWTWSMMAWHRPGPQPMPPMELYHFVAHGLKTDPAARWQSADPMLVELRRVLDGRVRVQCPFTLTKRATRQLSRFVDRRPWIALLLFAALLAGSIYGAVQAAQTMLS